MHETVQNLISIQSSIKSKLLKLKNKEKIPKIIAVSKTFKLDHILPLVEYGHLDYGENKVQEAIEKWSEIKIKNQNIMLHMVGKLQSNKVKSAVQIFDYIHSVDNKKIAKKISEEQIKIGKIMKIFIQVNVGNEIQKSGIDKNQIEDLFKYCKSINLNILGLMCLPPFEKDSDPYFKELKDLNDQLGFSEISMGMSNDYINAIRYNSTYLRIGSQIFGERN